MNSSDNDQKDQVGEGPGLIKFLQMLTNTFVEEVQTIMIKLLQRNSDAVSRVARAL